MAGRDRGLRGVDVWVNNAGRNSMAQRFAELAQEGYRLTVSSNLIGMMHGYPLALEAGTPGPGAHLQH